MPIETRERTIGEHRFIVHQLGFKEGRATLLRIGKVLGPTIAAALAKLESRGGEKQVTGLGDVLDLDLGTLGGAIGGAITTLFEHLTESELDHVTTVFAKKTFVGGDTGKSVPLDTVIELLFAGRYDDYLRWLSFCVEVNYGGFFGVAAKLGAALERRAEMVTSSASTSPNTSTGKSIESQAVGSTATA